MDAASSVRGVALDAAPRTSLHATARAYAGHGWAVFPVVPGGKVPVGGHGCLDATTDVDKVDRWWHSRDYNIGVATGTASGLVVVDLDGQEGVASFEALQHANGHPGDTAWVRTGSGGWHVYYAHPGGLSNSAGKLAVGIDVRADGGYVVAPPSVHPCGGVYRWVVRVDPSPPPGWLPTLLDPPPPPQRPRDVHVSGDVSAYAAAALEDEANAVTGTPPGDRNHRLNVAAFKLGTLVAAGALDESEVTGCLLDAARACGLIDDDGQRAAQNTIESGLRAGRQHPRDL